MQSQSNDYYEKIFDAYEFLVEKIPKETNVGIVLGTGLGSFSRKMTNTTIIPFSSIPHFPESTVEGHEGNLISGKINQRPILAMQGRFHYYEGYSMKEVTFPIRVFQLLGIQTIIISNAAGGVNENYSAGDIVFVSDHISMHQENPLRGENDKRLGVRFPDMLDTYSTNLIEKAERISNRNGIKTHRGVYFGWPGPNLETPAEYNMIHKLGGDLVGMSTIPEVIVAKHGGMDILVISVVTNECFPIKRLQPTGHKDVIDVAQLSEPKLSFIISELINEIDKES